MLLRSLIAPALIAGSIAAQTVTAPAIFANAEGGTTGNVWREVANRVQCFYDSSNFSSQGVGHPITINNLEFRLGGALATTILTYPTVNVYLQLANVNFLTPSTTFSANRTIDPLPAPNFSGPVTTLAVPGTTPNGFFINIPLSTSFSYIPDNGVDLLVEIEILGAPTPAAGNTISSGFVAATHLCNSVRSVGTTAALTGSISAFCPVIRFGYTDTPGGAKSTPYGIGCYKRGVSYYEQFAGSTNDLGGKTIAMTRNLIGGYDVATTVGATVVAPTSLTLGLGDDTVSAAIPLPFTFDYPGGSTTQIFVDSNGSVLLNGTAGSNIGGSGAAFMASTVHRLSPSIQDLDPSAAGGVFAEPDAANPTTVFLVTWQGVPCFGAGNPSTFQVALIDNGTNDSCQFRYQNLRNNSTSNAGVAVTGFTTGVGSNDPGSRDLTAGTFSTQTDTLPLSVAASARPIIGTAVNFTTSNIPLTSTLAMLFVGLAQIDPGIDLGIFGAPGCNIVLTLPELYRYEAVVSPTMVTNVAVPNDLNLVGALFYVGSATATPGVNAFGLLSSNGIALQVGSL